MLIYEALKNDHKKIQGLFERLVGSADATEESRKKLIQQIRDELVPHARAEEAVFYNSLRSIEETKDLVAHGLQEHLEMETLLRTLQGMNTVHADWSKVARKLKGTFEEHIRYEEDEVFPSARQVLAREEAEALSEAFMQLKPQVREEGFVKNTVDLIVNAMPPRFVDPIRQFFSRH